ncbi:uncharacterized protein VTP21DRAFT_1225 [Calcarisporiella thermophila]|uniref:uncharacterized protein n=1 Tax=Calcarisporiella thermophila TaxID=911321 RepID=UPI0037445497
MEILRASQCRSTFHLILISWLKSYILLLLLSSSSLLPSYARVYHTTTLLGQNKLVTIGGITGHTYANHTLVYDFASMTTKEIPTNLKIARHSTVVSNEQIVLMFGVIDGTGLSNTPWSYSVESGRETPITLAGSQAPPRKWQTVSVGSDGKLYAFGGSSTVQDRIILPQILGDVWTLDIKSGGWAKLAPAPPLGSVYGHASVLTANGFLVSCFGINGKGQVQNACTLLNTNTQQSLQPQAAVAPLPRAWATLVMGNDGFAYAFGGSDVQGKLLFNDVWELDTTKLPALSWRELKPQANDGLAPAARSGHTAVVAGRGRLMTVFGGETHLGAPSGGDGPFFLDLREMRWVDGPTARDLVALEESSPNSSHSSSSSNAHPTQGGPLGSGGLSPNQLSEADLSVGTYVGIGVGAALGFLGLVAAVWFLACRNIESHRDREDLKQHLDDGFGDMEPAKVLSSSPWTIGELDDDEDEDNEDIAYKTMDNVPLAQPNAAYVSEKRFSFGSSHASSTITPPPVRSESVDSTGVYSASTVASPPAIVLPGGSGGVDGESGIRENMDISFAQRSMATNQFHLPSYPLTLGAAEYDGPGVVGGRSGSEVGGYGGRPQLSIGRSDPGLTVDTGVKRSSFFDDVFSAIGRSPSQQERLPVDSLEPTRTKSVWQRPTTLFRSMTLFSNSATTSPVDGEGGGRGLSSSPSPHQIRPQWLGRRRSSDQRVKPLRKGSENIPLSPHEARRSAASASRRSVHSMQWIGFENIVDEYAQDASIHALTEDEFAEEDFSGEMGDDSFNGSFGGKSLKVKNGRWSEESGWRRSMVSSGSRQSYLMNRQSFEIGSIPNVPVQANEMGRDARGRREVGGSGISPIDERLELTESLDGLGNGREFGRR